MELALLGIVRAQRAVRSWRQQKAIRDQRRQAEDTIIPLSSQLSLIQDSGVCHENCVDVPFNERDVCDTERAVQEGVQC
eukprot:2843222-Amphidinium_carterae.1